MTLRHPCSPLLFTHAFYIQKCHATTGQPYYKDRPYYKHGSDTVFMFCSVLLQNGEELGMQKDRLMLLDETVVSASLTQLREVTKTEHLRSVLV